ncbi:uncharacterized protein VSU04_006819 isoform 2-T2 [Chlamydotis macqueenii]
MRRCQPSSRMRCAREQHGGVRRAGPGGGDGGCAEAVAVRSSLGNAVDCTRLRLVWAVSARPRSPGGAGAKMNGWSAYCLWRGAAAAEAGEATESRPDRQCALHSLYVEPEARWRTAKWSELQKRREAESSI